MAVADNVYGGLVIVMIVSLPLLALPVGYLRDGAWFPRDTEQPSGVRIGDGLIRRVGSEPNVWRKTAAVDCNRLGRYVSLDDSALRVSHGWISAGSRD